MLYLFLGLKIPLLLLYALVYWAIKAEPEPEDAGGDGGARKERPHPVPTLPRHPRRGCRGRGGTGCGRVLRDPPSPPVSSGSGSALMAQ